MKPTIVRTIARADPDAISRLGSLKAGELGLDMYGLRDLLAQRGVEWKD